MIIELTKRQIYVCPKASKIICEKGCLWVTWPEGRDAILKEREELLVKFKGKILIENMDSESSELQLIK